MSELVDRVMRVVKVMSDAERAELVKAIMGDDDQDSGLNKFVNSPATKTKRPFRGKGGPVWAKHVTGCDYAGKNNGYALHGQFVNLSDIEDTDNTVFVVANKLTHEYAVVEGGQDGPGTLLWGDGSETRIEGCMARLSPETDFAKVKCTLARWGVPDKVA